MYTQITYWYYKSQHQEIHQASEEEAIKSFWSEMGYTEEKHPSGIWIIDVRQVNHQHDFQSIKRIHQDKEQNNEGEVLYD